MTALPPPLSDARSGILLNGHLLPFDPKTIELLLEVNAACSAVLVSRKTMDDAKNSGETDLLSYASEYRIACVDEEVALDNLREHLKKFQ